MDGPGSGVDASIEHFGVKGMHWGVRRANSNLGGVARAVKAHGPAAAKGLKKDVTRKTFAKSVNKTGGLHKVSDEKLKKMLERMEMERKFSTMMNQEKARRAEGFKAVGKILGEVGKIALPILLTGFVATKAAQNSTFRTTATVVGKRALETGLKAVGR